ncbi:hypothetical protein B0H14DRAFT_3053327, partial [Mycena olivaceomarginata]
MAAFAMGAGFSSCSSRLPGGNLGRLPRGSLPVSASVGFSSRLLPESLSVGSWVVWRRWKATSACAPCHAGWGQERGVLALGGVKTSRAVGGRGRPPGRPAGRPAARGTRTGSETLEAPLTFSPGGKATAAAQRASRARKRGWMAIMVSGV